MKCPKCSFNDSKVVDSRVAKNGSSIRRRRECTECGFRFSTIEEMIPTDLFVIKSDQSRVEFNPLKIRDGIEKACYKRPVHVEDLDKVMTTILQKVYQLGGREIASDQIGTLVMDELEKLDKVAYVRFASVYRQFGDIQQYIKEIQELKKRSK